MLSYVCTEQTRRQDRRLCSRAWPTFFLWRCCSAVVRSALLLDHRCGLEACALCQTPHRQVPVNRCVRRGCSADTAPPRGRAGAGGAIAAQAARQPRVGGQLRSVLGLAAARGRRLRQGELAARARGAPAGPQAGASACLYPLLYFIILKFYQRLYFLVRPSRRADSYALLTRLLLSF